MRTKTAIIKYLLSHAPKFMGERRKFLIDQTRKAKEDYIMTDDGQEMAKAKVEEIREEIAELKNHLVSMNESAITCSDSEDWWWEMATHKIEQKIKGLEKRLWKFKNMIMVSGMRQVNEERRFNLDEIKEIPIDYLLETEPMFINHQRNFYKCPLHNETNASFVWYKDQNSFHCFGCSAHGDIIELYMRLHDCDFVKACRDLSPVDKSP